MSAGHGYGDVPQEAVVAMDVVIRHFPSLRYTVAGRSIYPPGQGGEYALGPVLELWKGAYTSGTLITSFTFMFQLKILFV